MGVILAPANGKGAALRLIEAGADEIYFGFYSEEWEFRFGGADINRMSGFGKRANVLSFDDLCEEIASVRSAEKKSRNNISDGSNDSNGAKDGTANDSSGAQTLQTRLFCTFNSATYTAEQITYITEHYLDKLASAGLTGIIVSDPQLIDAAHDVSLDVVASTMCSVYNEDIARFYQKCGVKRAILPRDLSLAEIESIVHAVPHLEYETFLMRNGCVFADSHCLGLHRTNCPSMCRTLRENSWWEIPASAPFEEAFIDCRIESGQLHKQWFHENTCGLCAIWRLEQANIHAYKVVGRSDALEDICADVALACENVAIAQTCDSESEYLMRMVRPDSIQTLCANRGLSCYYPEVRIP